MKGLTEYLTNDQLTNLSFVRTGDILLFTNDPKRAALLIISSTRSIWVHVGIAVWSESNPRRLLVLESTRGKLALDELTGEVRRGVRLTDIRNIIEEYQTVYVRPLDVVRDSTFRTQLANFMQIWKGTPYVSFTKIPFIPYFEFTDPGVSCSELTARFLKDIGKFDSDPELLDYPIKNFLPKHFAPGEELTTSLRDVFEPKSCSVVYKRSELSMDTIQVLCIGVLILLLLGLLIHYLKNPAL
jgi:hypothetical protein